MTEKPGVYAITNLVDGKRYVGGTVNISKRWSRHRKDLRAGRHPNSGLQAAWVAYGEGCFDFSVLLFCDRESVIGYEQRALDAWEACNPAKGYNEQPRAGVSMTMLGKSHSAETRAKIAESSRRAKPRDEPGATCPKGHIKDGTYRRANGRIRCQQCERDGARRRSAQRG